MSSLATDMTSPYYVMDNNSYNNWTLSNGSSGDSNSNWVNGWPNIVTDPFEFMIALIQLLLCIIAYSGNSLTLLVLSFDKKLKNNLQNRYIMSLAAADEMNSLNLTQLMMKNYFLNGGDIYLNCLPNIIIVYMCTALSLLNMLSIALDRYVYIVHPFVHMRHVTARRICFFIIIQWILAILYGTIPLYVFNADKSTACNPFFVLKRKFVTFSHPTFFCIGCLGIGLAYGLIARVAKQHYNRKDMRVQQISAITTRNAKSTENTNNAKKVHIALKENVREVDSTAGNFLFVPTATVISSRASEFSSSSVSSEMCVSFVDSGLEKTKNLEEIPSVGIDNDTTLDTKYELHKVNMANTGSCDTSGQISIIKDDESKGIINETVYKNLKEKDGSTAEPNENDFESAQARPEVSSVQSLTKIDIELKKRKKQSIGMGNSNDDRETDKTIPRKEINTNQTSLHTEREGNTSAIENPQPIPSQQYIVSPWNMASLRWMKQMVIVFGLFVVCWFPSMVCVFMSVSYRPSDKIVYILTLFGLSNSAVNFFVYTLVNKTYRKAIRKMCLVYCKCLTKSRN